MRIIQIFVFLSLTRLVCNRHQVVQGRILHGLEASEGQFPFMAAVYRKAILQELQFICGGSIINTNTVLTAAHCAVLSSLAVTLGSLRLYGYSDIVSVQYRIVHQLFDSVLMINDIGILKLENHIIFTATIKPILLPPAGKSLRDGTEFYKQLTVCGWGKQENSQESKTLKYVQLSTIDLQVCSKRFSGLQESIHISEKYICTFDPPKDSCQGDSGGPLFVKNGTNFYIVGIVSFGISCGSSEYPGVNTRVDQYIQWIINGSQNIELSAFNYLLMMLFVYLMH